MSYYDGVDGRRRSDPLRSLDIAPARAPDWQLCRVVTAQDTAPFSQKNKGINSGSYMRLRFMVTPMDADPTKDPNAALGGTANPNVEAMIWNEQAGAFVSFPTALTKTGVGAGVAYSFDVPEANGAIIACMVTNDPAGQFVAISAQGFDRIPDF